VPLMTLIAPLAQVTRSTNPFTVAAPYPIILLLYVTPPRAPGSRSQRTAARSGAP
jgi:hypothetical protein